VICNNSTGGYIWTWPGSVHGGMSIGSSPSKCSQQYFTSPDGTNLYGELPLINQ